MHRRHPRPALAALVGVPGQIDYSAASNVVDVWVEAEAASASPLAKLVTSIEEGVPTAAVAKFAETHEGFEGKLDALKTLLEWRYASQLAANRRH